MTDKQPEALRLADELDCRGMNRPSWKDQFDAGYELRRLHKENEAIRARLSQPEPAECDGGQCGIGGYCKECPKTQQEPTARDINEVILNSIHDSSEVVAQPQREWCQCKDAPNDCTYEKNCRVPQIDAAFKRIEWQGLTDEEITETLKRFGLGERAALARAIEAKLREKNAPDL